MQPSLFDHGVRPADEPALFGFVQSLIRAYESGHFGPAVHETHPELALGSRENYLYFTLAPALNFQRRSEGLWRGADATFRDDKTQFVFFPENVRRGRDAYARALARHSLAAFREKHTDIWLTVATTLHETFGNDPRALLAECGYDVVQVRGLVTASRRKFPYLSGPKLLNYWLYMLDSFTDVQFANRGEITIIPDVHVMAASVRLGLVPESVTSREEVARAWSSLLSGTDLAPIDLHGPLWRWGRLGFPALSECAVPGSEW
jgi:hypothetical protein